MQPVQPSSPQYAVTWTNVFLAGFILMVAYGVRLTVGLFVHPLMMDKGLTIAEISTALAIGQISWGLYQPLFGAWVDKGHAFAALFVGALCIVIGQFLTMASDNVWILIVAQGLFSPAGIAAGSFAILIGIVGSRIAPDKLSVASGIINSGGSVGQFVFAPIVQFFIHLRGYYASLMVLAGVAFLALGPAWILCKRNPPKPKQNTTAKIWAPETTLARESLREQIRVALRDRNFLLLNAGFFTCGFHVAFLVTHLPGEVTACGHTAAVSAASISLIGLCNIAGCIGAGILGKCYRMKYILAVTYAARAIMITMFMFTAKTEIDFYIFSAATGFTWLATVPPTAGIVGKLFGQRYVATLFGLTFFTHQIGGFFGAWLGGVAMETAGNLFWVWWVDIALATMAAIVNLPIREDAPVWHSTTLAKQG
jgi:Arabinose efflux permease